MKRLIIINILLLIMARTTNAQQISDNIVITILYNNISVSDSILADHGFSCLIESGDRSCLFDVGRIPDIFLSNVHKLGVNCYE
ncbi:MAG TPA: hypothetical protein VGD14_04675, partial [bacterium]